MTQAEIIANSPKSYSERFHINCEVAASVTQVHQVPSCPWFLGQEQLQGKASCDTQTNRHTDCSRTL